MINRFFDTPAHDHQTVSYDPTDGFPMSWDSTPPPAPTKGCSRSTLGFVRETHERAELYVAKARQSQVVLHCDDLDSGESDRVLILNDLRGGLSRGELTMHFQPQLDLTSGIVLGVEALVRWTHPVRGAIPPGEFIPAAEKTGLIRAITRFALRTALAACAEWRAAGRELRVAVNVSALNLVDASFVDDIVGALDEFGIPARLLDIEVTESNAMLDIGGAAQMLDQLAELGIRIVIDDFGTGHSSLEYLQRLPLDVIKIDQSFVKGMSVSSCDETIVRSTIGLARSLGMESVAEGVEDLAALDTLRSLGCNTAQGYAIARPMPQTDVLGAIEAIEQVHRRPAQPGAHAPVPNDEVSSGSARTRSRGSSA